MENEQMKYNYDDDALQKNAKIIVIGVGGGGSNAVNSMILDKSEEVEYWVFNTDCQALANSPVENKFILGKNVTRGLGAGGNPSRGKEAAEDSFEQIQSIVHGFDMCFIAAGEGGGTGTGAAPVVARAAREAGCLTLAIVTRPFTFEGKKRSTNALEGINELKENVDALIVVSNDKLVFNNGSLSVSKAFSASDQVLASSVKTVTDLILCHGVINLDFADVQATLFEKGLALIGIGVGSGDNKANEAALAAINSPLLESSIRGSKSMIINFTIGEDTSLDEITAAVNFITESAGSKENDANIIFGVQEDQSYTGKVKVSIIATDFDKDISVDNVPVVAPAAPKPRETPAVQEEVKPAVAPTAPKSKESALPDYLRNFFDSDEDKPAPAQPAAAPAVETKPEPQPVRASMDSVDMDDDDAIVIDRKY